MNEIRDEIIQYIQLDISPKDFELLIVNDPSLRTDINSMIYEGLNLSESKYSNARVLEMNSYDYLNTIKTYGGFSKAHGRSTAYTIIFEAASRFVAGLVKSSKYFDEFLDLEDSLPNYIGGSEADILIDELYTIEKRNGFKKSVFKRKLKELFKHNGKPPRWEQEPEWPLINGKPCLFLNQETWNDMTVYRFSDEFGEITEVHQYK